MSDTHTNQRLLRHVAGAVFWAVFIVLAPTEVLLFGALVWIPLLIWRERVRAARYGFLPGIIARFGIATAVIVTAAVVPTKHEDGRVGPLPRADISLGELAAAGVIYPLFDLRHDVVRVALPSTTPTRREVMRAITQQTGFRASIFHCGNGATVLFGSGGGRISVADKPKIKIAADGFPSGHDTPEGVACDLARAFIKHDAALFTNTCIRPFGASETFGTNYQTFLKNVIQSMKEEAAKKEPSPGAPKAITKVFAARHLSTRGPDSLAYAVFDFRGVMFVDLKTIRVNDDDAPYRIFVIKKNDDKWYVYPTPKSDSLLSAGLNSETESTKDFSEAYEVQK